MAGHELPKLSTVMGRLSLALYHRYRAGLSGIAIVPCDNLPHNGRIAREALAAFAETIGEDYAQWFSSYVSVCSTSIDRITPRSTDDDRELAQRLTGFADASPVVTEPFASWIIEGEFPAGRPAWENAAVVFTDNLEPFENRKLWLLNGAHTLMANDAANRGFETVNEAIRDPEVRRTVESWWDEASGHLPEHVEASDYRAALIERFENPNIRHLLSQIGSDSLTKLRARIIPVALAEYVAGREAPGAEAAIAAWISRQLAGEASPDSQDSAISEAKGAAEPAEALPDLLEPQLSDHPEARARILPAV